MPLRPEWFVLYGAVAVLYLFVAWREWLALKSESARTPVWHGPVLELAIGLHGVLLVHGVYVEGQLRFGFAHALSATLWITAIIVWIETFFSPSRGLFLLVLPLAAITTLLPVAYPGAILGQATEAERIMRAHAPSEASVKQSQPRHSSDKHTGVIIDLPGKRGLHRQSSPRKDELI